jgi:hypothetical protein
MLDSCAPVRFLMTEIGPPHHAQSLKVAQQDDGVAR